MYQDPTPLLCWEAQQGSGCSGLPPPSLPLRSGQSLTGQHCLKTLIHFIEPQILGNITAALSSVASGMKTSARILPGLEEAQDGQLADFLFTLVTYLQGWVTANYLAGSFEVGNKVGNDVGNQVGNKVGNKETQPRGALDWGGASAQVCLLTSEV